jgi:signal transduction histidine kinase
VTVVRSSSPSNVTATISFLLILIGLIVLTGWTFDLPILQSLGGRITMKANAAIGLLLCGIALGLLSASSPTERTVRAVCAVIPGILGGLTLLEHIAGWHLGIDQLLFIEVPGAAATTSPGRMGPNASTQLVLASIALTYLFRGDRRSVSRAQVIASLMAVIALIPIVGYVYGVEQLYAVARYTGIALHTGLACLGLSIGILAARPDTGPVSALTGDAPSASFSRRLLAAAVVLPLVFGYVRIIGQRIGLYDAAFGASIFAVSMVVVLSVTIWRAAVRLARSERARAEMQRDRDDLLVSERAAREQAERSDRAKDEFIAALSHELRTPLNAILGWMQMLQHGAVTGAAREKAADAVNRNAGLLARLIEDLLDTSRITTGRLELSNDALDINEVARAAAESVLPAATAKDISVVVNPASDAPPVVGDAHRLQQVIWNLLANAIKFSEPGTRVTIDVRATAREVTLTVRDEGEGIAPTLLPHVFDQFRRGDAVSSSGLGLGLYIARHLTELHGGTIRAVSDGPGRGATFTVHLPVRDHRSASAVR